MRWHKIYCDFSDEYIYFVSMGADLVCKGGDAGDASAHYQGVDVVRALVRVDRLQVHHVPDWMGKGIRR